MIFSISILTGLVIFNAMAHSDAIPVTPAVTAEGVSYCSTVYHTGGEPFCVSVNIREAKIISEAKVRALVEPTCARVSFWQPLIGPVTFSDPVYSNPTREWSRSSGSQWTTAKVSIYAYASCLQNAR